MHEEREFNRRRASMPSGCMELRAPDIEKTTRQGWSSRCQQRGAPPCAARSWDRDGLLRHDGKVEGVVVEGDAVLVLGIHGRARYAQAYVPKRRSHHRVPRVLQGWLSRHEELVGLLGSAVDFLQESYHRRVHSSTG